jgi:hypothetical protein
MRYLILVLVMCLLMAATSWTIVYLLDEPDPSADCVVNLIDKGGC